MSNEIQIALLGIVGTLVGTILGWVLNTLSQRGRLNIFISSWIDKFEYNKVGYMTPSSSVAQTESYSYCLSLDLYNSSGTTKIMRNLEVIFLKDKTELNRSIPKDDSTKRYGTHTAYYDVIEPINIPPKTVLKIVVHEGYWKDELSFLWEVDRVFLKYTNEKNQEKRILIKKELYKNYFDNHRAEEQDNGQ